MYSHKGEKEIYMDKKSIKEMYYSLGMIANVIYGDNFPRAMMQYITRPLELIALMSRDVHVPRRRDEFGKVRKSSEHEINEIARLMDNISPDLPRKNTNPVDEGAFWNGYYHYMAAVSQSRQYGAKELAQFGFAIFGEQWQTPMSRALKLSDSGRLREWLSGQKRIPAGVWAELGALLRARQKTVEEVLRLTVEDEPGTEMNISEKARQKYT